MKVRRKKKTKHQIGEYPEKGTPEYEQLSGKEKKLANLKRPWKKGRSGNPIGRPHGQYSVVACMKHMLKQPGGKKKYETIAHELAGVSVQQARRGHIDFMRLVVDKTESKELTREQLEELLDRMHEIVSQYVHDPKALAKIANAFQQLKLREE